MLMATAFFRTIILYLLLIAGLRLTGKRQIGELEPIELVLTMLLSDLASVPMQDFDSPLINGVVPILTLLALTTLLSYISFRSGRFRSLICGEPAIVVRYGKLQQRAMRHNRMTVDELLEELRGQGVTDLKDVQYAVLETSGQVSVLLRSQAQPVTPRQLSLNVTEPLLPVLLINDGRLLRDNMKKMDVDDAWLRKQLKREHLTDPSQVFFLSLDQGGQRDLPGQGGRMKRFLIVPSLVLAVLLALCILNAAALNRRTNRWMDQADQIAQLAEQERWDMAREAMDDLSADWESAQDFLHVVIHHETLDAAQVTLSRCRTLCRLRQGDDLLPELAQLRQQLQQLDELERLSLRNIL